MIDIEEHKDIAIVLFKEKVTRLNVENFRDKSLSEMILAKTDRVKVIINMRNIAFLDSAALGRIVGVHKALAEKNGLLALCEMVDDIANLVHMVGLHKVLEICDSEEEAIEKLSA